MSRQGLAALSAMSFEGPWSRLYFLWYFFGVATLILLPVIGEWLPAWFPDIFHPDAIWMAIVAICAGFTAVWRLESRSQGLSAKTLGWHLFKDSAIYAFWIVSISIMIFLMGLARFQGLDGRERGFLAAIDQVVISSKWISGAIVYLIVAYGTLGLAGTGLSQRRKPLSPLSNSSTPWNSKVALTWFVIIATIIVGLWELGECTVEPRYTNNTDLRLEYPSYVIFSADSVVGTGRAVTQDSFVSTAIIGRYDDGTVFADGSFTYDRFPGRSEGVSQIFAPLILGVRVGSAKLVTMNPRDAGVLHFRRDDPQWFESYPFHGSRDSETYRFRTDRGNVTFEIVVRKVCRQYELRWSEIWLVPTGAAPLGCW